MSSYPLGAPLCVMHNGRMAAADTHPPESQEGAETAPECADCSRCACFADQEALGRLLAEHEDPHVRIIAHMSNRQLALSESVGDLTKLIFKTAGAVHTLQERSSNVIGELRTVTTTLEKLVASVDGMSAAVKALTEKHDTLEERVDGMTQSSEEQQSTPPV